MRWPQTRLGWTAKMVKDGYFGPMNRYISETTENSHIITMED